jgi:hypothetical protein
MHDTSLFAHQLLCLLLKCFYEAHARGCSAKAATHLSSRGKTVGSSAFSSRKVCRRGFQK